MRTRAPLIVLALSAVTAAVFCFRAWDKKPDANEESPAVASHRSLWLNAAHHSTCQVEDPLIRDALLLRLLPYCVRAGDTTLALQILEKVEDKASAHVEYAVAARQSNDMDAYRKHMDAAFVAIHTLVEAYEVSYGWRVSPRCRSHVEYAVAARRRNDMAAYRKHLDAAFEIADAICEDDGSYDDRASDRSSIYRSDIVSTLIEAGYVDDAVSISLRVSTTLLDWDRWKSWFDGKRSDLVWEGRIADARCTAAISWDGPTQAYVEIAEGQCHDGDGPGATETLQEALAHVDQSDSPLDKAYCFSLIAAAFARNGDRTEAIDARARCHQALTAVNTSKLQESGDTARAARTYAKLAHASALLEEPEEAKRRLAQADSILAKKGDDSDNDENAETVADIAEVWMCLNEQDTALAVAAAQRDRGLYIGPPALERVITHRSFSATPEVTGRILAGLPDNREYVLACLVIHHLHHGRVAQAQVLAETIGGVDCRGWADKAVFDKLCELRAIDQAIDTLPRVWPPYDADRAIKKLCERASIKQAIYIAARIDGTYRDAAYRAIIEKLRKLSSVEQAIEIAAGIDDTHRDAAYRAIIEKQCELGSIEQAIDIAARIDKPRTELDVFQLIGKTLAKSRSIAELESFLTAQSKPTRLAAAYLGVLEALVTDAEPNDRFQTDGASAAPPPDP